MEIHRIDEAAATPLKEGAPLSECYSNNKRIECSDFVRLFVSGFFIAILSCKAGRPGLSYRLYAWRYREGPARDGSGTGGSERQFYAAGNKNLPAFLPA